MIKCQYCGEKIRKDSVFCNKCGKKLEIKKKSNIKPIIIAAVSVSVLVICLFIVSGLVLFLNRDKLFKKDKQPIQDNVEVVSNTDNADTVLPEDNASTETVEAEPEIDVTEIFTDVKPGAWYVDTVKYVYEKGIMTGTGNGDTFEPDAQLTRGQFVMILYSMEGKPEVAGENVFTDVNESAYYANSTVWASEKGITAGTGDENFSPNNIITREQLVIMLYKFAGMKGYDLTTDENALNEFKDTDKVSQYATEAVKWALTQDIISGKETDGELKLDPQRSATRAECATMIMKLIEKNK